MAPFLFILAMEGLHVMIEDAIMAGAVKGLQIGNMSVSHLMYADDVIMMGEWSEDNLLNIMSIFNCFFLVSGLKVSVQKSKLYGIGVRPGDVVKLAEKARCKEDKLPFNYLGVPAGASMARCDSWDPIVKKFEIRLSKWKANLLSVGGRSVLIKSVLGALPIYYFSLFKVPEKVRRKLESSRARFFWGGDSDTNKIHWVKWETIIGSTERGWLGFGSLHALNIALLLKWRWRFVNSPNAMRVKLINNVHKNKFGLDRFDQSRKLSSTWGRICDAIRSLHDDKIIPLGALTKKVGNGTSTSFWHDHWIRDQPLVHTFPWLYRLELEPNVDVASRWDGVMFNWNWKREIYRGSAFDQLRLLSASVSGYQITDSNDRWQWNYACMDEFSVSGVRKSIDESTLPSAPKPTRWNKVVPAKVNIFVWRLLMDRLPTRMNLSLRGIDIPSIFCPNCEKDFESASHIMVDCEVVKRVWYSILKWLNVDLPTHLTPLMLLQHIDMMKYSEKAKSKIETIINTVWWSLWRFRNDAIFAPDKQHYTMLVDMIIVQAFVWYRHRKKDIAWVEWLQNPLLF